MKNVATLCAVLAWVICACSGGHTMTVCVTNPLPMERTGEMVELSMSKVAEQLRLADTAQVVVMDADGTQLPWQLTYDGKLIFPATVAASGQAVYTLRAGTPESFGAISCGRHYPDRLDDVAWENDLGGYRAYGPALQARGDKGYGYDLFTKYNTTEPILEEMYAQELNEETRARIGALRQTDPAAAEELQRAVSYHIDHGYGMDCYAVGPTLGAGTTALLVGDTLLYPYCYRVQEVLDNGPLRFTVRLEFEPRVVGADTAVVETRLITLDAGSHLNRTAVSYTGLQAPIPLAVGIVLRDADGALTTDATMGYMSYADPTIDRSGASGKIWVGTTFPVPPLKTEVVRFAAAEQQERGGAHGHLLATDTYEPGSEYTYYWGFAWSKAGVPTQRAWDELLRAQLQCVRAPLVVSY